MGREIVSFNSGGYLGLPGAQPQRRYIDVRPKNVVENQDRYLRVLQLQERPRGEERLDLQNLRAGLASQRRTSRHAHPLDPEGRGSLQDEGVGGTGGIVNLGRVREPQERDIREPLVRRVFKPAAGAGCGELDRDRA